MKILLTIITIILLGLAGRADVSSKLPPCATEDSTHCYWDAQSMGNGTGDSFINL